MEHALKRYRTEKGLKLRQVAEMTGLTVAYLSQIETGVRDPSTKTIALLCEKTGLSPNAFFAVPGPLPEQSAPSSPLPAVASAQHIAD